jgi:feruloyl esterase
MRTGHSNLAVRAMRVAFNRLAPPDAAGKPQPALAFSDADRKAVVQGVLDACDANDGTKDGLIFDTRGCRFSPASLACKGPKADGCLSPQQVAAIEKAFAGPRDSKGRQVYPKFLYDTGIVTPPWHPGHPDAERGSPVRLCPASSRTSTRRGWPGGRAGGPTDTARRPTEHFSGRGGSAFYHGVSDPWFSAMDTVECHERRDDNGGADASAAGAACSLAVDTTAAAGARRSVRPADAPSQWVEGHAGRCGDRTHAPGRSRPLCALCSAHYRGPAIPRPRDFECA